MRRFSQRSALVTLSEINITPLLDLAFVLLIIFIITTPLLAPEQSMDVKLPTGGVPDKPLDKSDLRTVEITKEGTYKFNRYAMTLAQIEENLKRDFKANPNLVVVINADKMGRTEALYAVIDSCQKNGITRFKLGTVPPKR